MRQLFGFCVFPQAVFRLPHSGCSHDTNEQGIASGIVTPQAIVEPFPCKVKPGIATRYFLKRDTEPVKDAPHHVYLGCGTDGLAGLF